MAEGTRSGSRQRRSDAREKRRALAAKPFEELDEAAGTEQSGGAARSTLKQAAATAALGALAAGVGGAAKALVDRRDEPEPEPKQRELDEEPELGEEGGAEPQAQAGEEQVEEPEEDEQPEERADDSEQRRGARMNDAKQIVAEAKRELEELLGAEVESVSGFHRSDGGWTVTLEVVNLRRIPDTTDVLSSYEVVLDDDRNLVSISETRRYRRSQVEEG
jgi:Gas vesicle synthesis protein GvpO